MDSWNICKISACLIIVSENSSKNQFLKIALLFFET